MSDVCAGERKLGIGTGKVWGNALIIETNFIFYISIYGVDIPLLPGTVNTFEITFCLLCVFLLRLWRQSSCPGKFWGWKNKKMTWCGGLGHWSHSCYKWCLSSRILNHCKEIKRFLKCTDNLRKGDRKTLVASGWPFSIVLFVGLPAWVILDLLGWGTRWTLFIMSCVFERPENSFSACFC